MATNTIDTLYGPAQLTAASVALVAGTSAGTMVKYISIINTAGTSETVELHIHTAAPGDAQLVTKIVLAPGDTGEWTGTMIVPTGSSLYGKSTNATAVTISVHGMDMT